MSRCSSSATSPPRSAIRPVARRPGPACRRRRSTRTRRRTSNRSGDILDMSEGRLEVRRNSEWLAQLGMEDILRLTSQVTVARMLERDDFANRYRDGVAISLMEFLYPLLQGTDSVAIHADVELGGTDQLFNLLVGRHLQQQAGQDRADRAHHAAARRPRRHEEDVEVAGQLRRHRGTAGRAVRQADVDPRRRAPACTSGTRPRGRPRTWTPRSNASLRGRCTRTRPSASSPAPSSTSTTPAGAGVAAEAEFDRVFKAQADARRRSPSSPSVPAPLALGRCSWRRSWSRRSAKHDAMIDAGSVRVDDEKVTTDTGVGRPRARRAGGEAQVGEDLRHIWPHRLTRTTRHWLVSPFAPHAGLLSRAPERRDRLTPTLRLLRCAPTCGRAPAECVSLRHGVHAVACALVGESLLENRAVKPKASADSDHRSSDSRSEPTSIPCPDRRQAVSDTCRLDGSVIPERRLSDQGRDLPANASRRNPRSRWRV